MKKIKKNFTEINYRKAFLSTIKTKYFDFILGLLVFYTVFFSIFKIIPVDFNFNFPSILRKTSPKPITPQIPQKNPTKQFQKYTVQPGDTLSLISMKFYNDMFAWQKIIEANKILNPDNLEVGTVLIIP